MQKIKYPVGSKFIGTTPCSEASRRKSILVDKSKDEHACLLKFSEEEIFWITQESLENYYTLVSTPPWIPEIGDTYFTIYNDGSYGDWCWTGDKVDLFRLKTDNVKRTREECQKKIDEINSRDI
jgi:hypothetical protein